MSEDLQPARTEPLKIGVLISGSGTNLQALIDAIDEGTLNAQIVIVISSKPGAKGASACAESRHPDAFAQPRRVRERTRCKYAHR